MKQILDIDCLHFKQGSSVNRDCNLAVTFHGGGHIGFCTKKPPEVELNLFAMVFENIMPISNTMPKYKN